MTKVVMHKCYYFLQRLLAGNEFSTLDNVVFQWSIVGLGKNKDVTVLRFMAFKDSPYEGKPSIMELEERNQRGNVALLEGIKTGSAKVNLFLW